MRERRWRGVNEALAMSNLRARELMSEPSLDEENLRVRERQQATIADLGQRALSGIDLQDLMEEAAGLLASTLAVQYTEILELLPGDKQLLLRAGAGWKEGYAGLATVDAGTDSQGGYTLLTGGPVIVEDLPGETRFNGSPLLKEHGAVSGFTVIIQGRERPFGVLGVHAATRREFSLDDVDFLQSAATVLAMAIERKGMEQELQHSRDQLRAILEGVADGITVQDLAGKMVFANDAAARFVGYPSAQALIDAPLAEVLDRFEFRDVQGHPFPPSEFPGRKVIQGQEASDTTLRIIDKVTGEERWSIFRARPVLDEKGRPRMAINIFRDITQRKRAEESQRFLADATALLATSLDYETTLRRVAELAVPHVADRCAVHLVSDDGQLRSLELAHVDQDNLGPARQIERRYALEVDKPWGVPKVIRTGKVELYSDVPDDSRSDGAPDTEFLTTMREMGIRSAMIVPMVARGRTLGAVTFVSAESGRHYGPDDLELAQHLGRRAALAVDNARLYRDAQEAIRMRNELFSSVSHDLKNPLTGIKGMAQLLRRQISRMDAPGKDRLIEGLSSIDATASRMTAQIDELLDLARLQMGQPLGINRRRMDLANLVREVAMEQKRTTERHHITVETTPSELIGNWDPVRLGRVIANLLANAIKYSPAGGEIRVTMSQEDRGGSPWAVLSVQDHGIGIPEADLPRVFEGFHRAGNVAAQIAGTGLGLTSARQIVELHGGTIEAASEEGIGSTFTVKLPLAPPRESRLEPAGEWVEKSTAEE
jgi:PAS domain S-box-containing protein